MRNSSLFAGFDWGDLEAYDPLNDDLRGRPAKVSKADLLTLIPYEAVGWVPGFDHTIDDDVDPLSSWLITSQYVLELSD